MEYTRVKKTEYNGYLFRSKLEAIWAVFFDQLKVKYIYEPEAFLCSDGSQYTPDFYLPDCCLRQPDRKGVYLEIKPLGWEEDKSYIHRITTAFGSDDETGDETGDNFILIEGQPFDIHVTEGNPRNYQLCPYWDNYVSFIWDANTIRFDYWGRCQDCETLNLAARYARKYKFKFFVP